MEREEKQGTYFPVYPNLRNAKRLGSGKRRDRRRKVEEETRACYCDYRPGKEGSEMVREQLALRTCGKNNIQMSQIATF